MNRLEKLAQSIATIRRKSSWDSVFLKNLEFSSTDNVKSKPYSKSALAYICISKTAKAISQVPFTIQIRRGDAWEEVGEEDIWQQRFNRPSIYMGRYTFKEAIVSHLLLDGNIWILPFPLKSKRPDQLYIIRKKYMEAVKDNQSGQLTGWRYRPEEKKNGFLIALDEIAHIKFFNPYDDVFGQKPLEAGNLPLLSDYKAAKYNEVFFDEGAVPGGIFSTKEELSDPFLTRFKQNIDSRHKGFRKSHRYMLLENDLKYEQVGLTQKDMQFIDLRRYSRDEVLQCFGMLKSVLGITDDINYATAKEQRREWWQDTNIPLMRLVQEAINFSFFEGGKNIRGIYDTSSVEALQEEFDKKVETAAKLWQIGFTANEINHRLELGFDEKPWRDYWYYQISLLPISDKPEAPVQDSRLLTDGEVKVIENRDFRLEAIWNSYIAKVTPIENLFQKKVSRVFYEMRKVVLGEAEKKVDGQIITKATPEELLGWIKTYEFKDEKEKIAKYSAPIYENAIKEGWEALLSEVAISIDFDLNDPILIEYLQAKPIKIKNVIDTVKQRTINQIQEGIEAGESIDKIVKRIKQEFTYATTRAKTIARTEVVGSSNFGRFHAINQSGFHKKQWFTALDEKVRADHIAMQGKIIGVDDKWILPDGTWLSYPGDFNGAAGQIIQCRCIEVIPEE